MYTRDPMLHDGKLRFESTGDVVGPGMSGPEFQQLGFVRDSGYREGTFTGTARLGLHQLHDRLFFVSFGFVKSRLCRVELCMKIDVPAGREDWAYETEIERKQAHERWCADQLDAPLRVVPSTAPGAAEEKMQEGVYPWGTIRSIYDGRGGAAYLRLEYAE